MHGVSIGLVGSVSRSSVATSKIEDLINRAAGRV